MQPFVSAVGGSILHRLGYEDGTAIARGLSLGGGGGLQAEVSEGLRLDLGVDARAFWMGDFRDGDMQVGGGSQGIRLGAVLALVIPL